MINITVYFEGELIHAIELRGHSGYAEAGSDIICSAVSTLAQNCEMGLKEMLNIPTNYVVKEKDAYLRIDLPKNMTQTEMHDSQILMKSTYLGLKSLSNSESKYISIKEKRK